MEFIFYIFILLQIFIGAHFFIPFFNYLICKIRKNSYKDLKLEESDYAVIVTAYQQVDLVPMAVNSILAVDYNNYVIYVVADNCDVSTLFFNDERVVILRPEEVLASNIKSHFYAIDRFIRPHERITIIDSDNLVDADYFKELDQVFARGFEAIQGIRAAKNLNSVYACLDEAGDIYYRYTDRKLLFEVGSSSALSGSGMAFTTRLYKDCLENTLMKGAGFDKILQYEILNGGRRIAFAEKAIVLDEKTARTDQLVNQRSRWINTWFRYFFLGIKMFLGSIKTLSWNKFVFSTMLLRPPLFMLIGLSFLFVVADLFIFPSFLIFWGIAFVLFFIIVFQALSHFKADEKIYHSLRNAPKFIYFQILALLKVRKANKISVATRHFYDKKNEE